MALIFEISTSFQFIFNQKKKRPFWNDRVLWLIASMRWLKAKRQTGKSSEKPFGFKTAMNLFTLSSL